MSGFTPPPPGSMPPGAGAPDMDALQDMMGGQAGHSPKAGAAGTTPHSSSTSSTRLQPVQEVKNIAQDVGKSFTDFLPPELQFLVGKADESPEEAAKRKQMLQKFNQLSEQDRQYVQKKYHEQEMEKRQKEQEEHARRQQEAAQQSQSFSMPQGKVTGEQAAGKSNKQNTIDKLNKDRQKPKNSG